ncbi:MAG: HRDC domain-containing protein, partial [Alphaproteobacteria bacterium]|nr:HRDC domain-containing protein [Alphaproteobacteria bacterium]
WRSIFRQLYAAGAISLEVGEFASWSVTESGAAILRGAERLELRRDVLRAAGSAKRKQGAATAAAGAAAADHEVEFALLTALKELRRDIARRLGQPAYVVFTDRTLLELAALRPKTLEEMHDIHGIGQTKLKKYGAAFLEVVARHES